MSGSETKKPDSGGDSGEDTGAVIVPSSLTEEELGFEIHIRGLDFTAECPKWIKKNLLVEHVHRPAEDEAVANLNPTEELKILQVKVTEVRALLTEAKTRQQ